MAGKPEIVKVGSVEAPVYANQSGVYRSFTICFYREGKRQRRTFSNPAEAREEARTIARRIANGNARATDLTSEERDMLRRAQNRLRPLGTPLDEAIWEYVRAKNLVNGGSWLPSAQNYARSFIDVKQGMLVSKAAKECLQASEIEDFRTDTSSSSLPISAAYRKRSQKQSARSPLQKWTSGSIHSQSPIVPGITSSVPSTRFSIL